MKGVFPNKVLLNRILMKLLPGTAAALLAAFTGLGPLWFPAGALSSAASAAPGVSDSFDAYGGGGSVSLDLRGVDLRDVLSALAIKMGVNVVIVNNEPLEVTFKAGGITARKAFEMIIQSNGLAYLQNGDLIVVGKAGTLQQDFFSQMILTRFDTAFVPAEKIVSMIKELGLGDSLKVLSIDTNPNVFWAQGTVQSLRKVREIVSAVDSEDNRVSSLSLDYRTILLTSITPPRAVELLKEAGLEIKRHIYLDNKLLVFDSDLFPQWDKVLALVKQLDVQTAGGQRVFVYPLKNIVAADAAERLKKFGFKDVETVTYNNDRLGREIMVICPPYLEYQVRAALESLDERRSTTRAFLAKVTGQNAYERAYTIRKILSEISGVSRSNINISDNLTEDDDNPEYVLWVEETPDNIQLVKDLLKDLKLDEEKTTEEQ
ncbi:MAG: energy transducer TonB [Firmicutes bacterium]|nr:energy transducer TonB [Bacillota bacterium]